MAVVGIDLGSQSTKVVIVEGDPIVGGASLSTGESAETEARLTVEEALRRTGVARADLKGEVADFVMNDKCAGGSGRFMRVAAEVLQVPLAEVGPRWLNSTEVLPFSTSCAAVTVMKEGERKEDILAGLHEAIATRVAMNVGLVGKTEQQLDGLKVTLPQEPMIVGAVGAALFALDQARKAAVGGQAAPEPA